MATLISDKNTFVERLTERIRIGKDLLNTITVIINGDSNKRDSSITISSDECLKDIGKWDEYNCMFLQKSFGGDNAREYVDKYNNVFYKTTISQVNRTLFEQEFLGLKINELEGFLEQIDMIAESPILVSTPQVYGDKIFIVHGHNDGIKEEVARLLEKIHLEPIILNEQVNKGQTLIEKLETESSEVGYAIILLTADDLGRAKEEGELSPRARQNVIFEMGYFMGKLGRERVVLLYDEHVNQPSDIFGITYYTIDSNDGWKGKLVNELQKVGYKIDFNTLYSGDNH